MAKKGVNKVQITRGKETSSVISLMSTTPKELRTFRMS